MKYHSFRALSPLLENTHACTRRHQFINALVRHASAKKISLLKSPSLWSLLGFEFFSFLHLSHKSLAHSVQITLVRLSHIGSLQGIKGAVSGA